MTICMAVILFLILHRKGNVGAAILSASYFLAVGASFQNIFLFVFLNLSGGEILIYTQYTVTSVVLVSFFALQVLQPLGEMKFNLREIVVCMLYIVSGAASGISFFHAVSMILLCLFVGEAHKRATEKEADAVAQNELSQAFIVETAYLKRIEENYERTRELWHDLSNHAIAIYALADKPAELKKYLSKWSEDMQRLMLPVRTGNMVIDAVIGDKYYSAQKAGIDIMFNLCPLGHLRLEPGDICAVFGNAFDNAIEACMRLKDISECFIDIRSSVMSGRTDIVIENSSAAPASPTSKLDTAYHGIGLRSIERSVSKYGGQVKYKYENNKFTLSISFFDNDKN